MKCHYVQYFVGLKVSTGRRSRTSMKPTGLWVRTGTSLLSHVTFGSSAKLVKHRHGTLTCLDPWVRGNWKAHTSVEHAGVRLGEKRPHFATPRTTNSCKQITRHNTQKSELHYWNIQNMQLADLQTTQPLPAAGTSKSMPSVRRAAVRRPGHQPRRQMLGTRTTDS